MQVIFSSPATVAILVACFLDCTHSLAHIPTRRDSGRYWWERFRYFSQDTRSEEFYTLPWILNSLIVRIPRFMEGSECWHVILDVYQSRVQLYLRQPIKNCIPIPYDCNLRVLFSQMNC
uniref:Secreted protein n=1 Tax=Populus davidiana TaxID=266767 RepID=A0A6M2FAP1_9ROSI